MLWCGINDRHREILFVSLGTGASYTGGVKFGGMWGATLVAYHLPKKISVTM